MAILKVYSQRVRCDGCGIAHGDGTAETAMAARIAAGINGWVFAQSHADPRERGPRHLDYCPRCKDGAS